MSLFMIVSLIGAAPVVRSQFVEMTNMLPLTCGNTYIKCLERRFGYTGDPAAFDTSAYDVEAITYKTAWTKMSLCMAGNEEFPMSTDPVGMFSCSVLVPLIDSAAQTEISQMRQDPLYWNDPECSSSCANSIATCEVGINTLDMTPSEHVAFNECIDLEGLEEKDADTGRWCCQCRGVSGCEDGGDIFTSLRELKAWCKRSPENCGICKGNYRDGVCKLRKRKMRSCKTFRMNETVCARLPGCTVDSRWAGKKGHNLKKLCEGTVDLE